MFGQNAMDTLNFGTARWVTKLNPARVDKRHERDSSGSEYIASNRPEKLVNDKEYNKPTGLVNFTVKQQ